MSARLEELAWSSTPMGEISLRRRQDPEGGDDIYEVKLDDDFLMSSQYVVAEVEVARLAAAFHGHGVEGLKMLGAARDATGLPVIGSAGNVGKYFGDNSPSDSGHLPCSR